MLEFARDSMQPAMQILEVGGGGRPLIAVERRPSDALYVCLDPDPSGREQGGYTEFIVGAVEDWHLQLADRFDLVVSCNALEHVPDLAQAFANIHGYLKPGGMFTALFSGRWSLFSVAARLMPHRARAALLLRFLGRAEEDHFSVRYDRCRYSKLVRLLDDAQWVEPVVLPLYQAATYLDFRGGTTLKRAYIRYENWSRGHPNLATHYIVSARRRGG